MWILIAEIGLLKRPILFLLERDYSVFHFEVFISLSLFQPPTPTQQKRFRCIAYDANNIYDSTVP